MYGVVMAVVLDGSLVIITTDSHKAFQLIVGQVPTSFSAYTHTQRQTTIAPEGCAPTG